MGNMPRRVQKPEVAPVATIDHDRKQYHIEIELPGIDKNKIELDFGERSFCVRAPRDDIVFNACYYLAHKIDVKKVNATFTTGLLKVLVPLKEPLGGKRVPVK